MAVAGPLDRSAIFTLLLEYLPGFGAMSTKDAEPLITEVTEMWRENTAYTDMAEFVKAYIEEQDDSRQEMLAQRIKVRSKQRPANVVIMAINPVDGRWYKLGQYHHGIEEARLREFWDIIERW